MKKHKKQTIPIIIKIELLKLKTRCHTSMDAKIPAVGEPKKEAKVYPKLQRVACNGSVFSATTLVIGA